MNTMDLFSDKANQLVSLDQIKIEPGSLVRIPTGFNLIDQELFGGDPDNGYGLLKGSVFMLGGEPGSGKSTLLLQLLDKIAGRGLRCVYNSAEEPAPQLKLTAKRCQVQNPSNLFIGNIGEVEKVIEVVQASQGQVLVVDSIQGFHVASLASKSKLQHMVDGCNLFIKLAKDTGIPLVIICQLTSEGKFKGPKDLEHNVDICGKLSVPASATETGRYRILNLSKNRFGPVGQKYLPWLGDVGRFNVDEFNQRVEIAEIEKKEPKLRKVVFGSDEVNYTDDQKLAMVMALAEQYPSKDPFQIMVIMQTIRNRYGEFEVSEYNYEQVGMPQDKWLQLLRAMAKNPEFGVISQEPLVILV